MNYISRRALLGVFCSFLVAMVSETAFGHFIYIAHGGANAVDRYNFNGSNGATLYNTTQQPFGVSVDLTTDLLYWSEGSVIKSAPADGSGFPSVVVSGGAPRHIVAHNQVVYWADGDGWIKSLSGGVVATLWQANNPSGIALHVSSGTLYWTEPGKIMKGSVFGGYPLIQPTTVLSGLTTVREIDIDPDEGKMYWVEFDSVIGGRVRRANLNGSNVQFLYQAPCNGIAIDLPGNKIYWTTGNKIQRAPQGGGGTVETLVTGLSNPRGIFLQRTS